LVKTGQQLAEGQTPATRYRISLANQLFGRIDINTYFEKEIDEREIQDGFNFGLITDVLRDVNLFTPEEANTLQQLQEEFLDNISHMTTAAYNKELERLAIDLSWKSSQIEGYANLLRAE